MLRRKSDHLIEKRVGRRIQDNFWDNAVPIPECGCFVWIRKINPNGYGAVRFKGKQVLAHRVAWVLTYGTIPEGSQVLHKCDVKSCINPHHLFLGTQKDNMLDMKKKGRSTLGKRYFKTKITEADVVFIRSSKDTRFNLARKFNVSMGHISDIRVFRRWIPGVKAISKKTQI